MLLALCGFPVFCGEAELPHFAGIHLLCEDMEDSLGGLSSFGGEMIHFDGILSEIKTESTALVLLVSLRAERTRTKVRHLCGQQ